MPSVKADTKESNCISLIQLNFLFFDFRCNPLALWGFPCIPFTGSTSDDEDDDDKAHWGRSNRRHMDLPVHPMQVRYRVSLSVSLPVSMSVCLVFLIVFLFIYLSLPISCCLSISLYIYLCLSQTEDDQMLLTENPIEHHEPITEDLLPNTEDLNLPLNHDLQESQPGGTALVNAL